MLRVLQIPQNDYGIPTLKSSNRYIPYTSGKYKGKRYVYIEGDSGTDSGYTDQYSDITSSSESEYEEFDINDIYVPHAPKYKTLIEVVLEPSKRDTQNDIPSGDTIPNSGNTIPTSDIPNTPSDIPPPITDEEWNELKHDFISNMLQNTQPNDLPNNNISGTTPTNTNNTTMSRHNVDNNTHPTPSRDTLDQKPFIMSIHDRNLLNGEECNYDMINNIGNNDLYGDIYTRSGDNVSYIGKNGPYSGTKDPYSGIDLINDALSGNHDIYNEILKRKENELFGTKHVKQTSTHSVAKNTYSDPIECQLNLFHKWLDRHRDMCEKLKNDNERLAKLKEEWNKDNNKHNGENNINKMLNTDVSIQIDMSNPKTTNEFTYVDSNPNQVDDNIYLDTYPDQYTVDNINPVDENPTNNPNIVENMNPNITLPSNTNLVRNQNTNITLPSNPNLVGNNINPVDENPTNPNPNHVQIQMSVKNNKMAKENFPIGDVWGI
ncbi:erythrocyte membrane protein 1, EMP1, exon 2 [Plasmodium reichenowi]|uniref:Erythrocyte membrane protein 1, EMP1, exon 2 n=1 Tax=Plasmodium reichenowi TaxID=5854 RepID=A0A060RMR0_PLARE|nr:erythrocyte membrane protein 1, EMP1, exon 2 [Plasmodium reichenowi]